MFAGLGKSCSFRFLRVTSVNVYQYVYVLLVLFVLMMESEFDGFNSW